jgi:site-specific recombinase XerD
LVDGRVNRAFWVILGWGRILLVANIADKATGRPVVGFFIQSLGIKWEPKRVPEVFRRVVRNAGLDEKEVVRHTLRHTAITHLVQAGVDLPTVQRISGHKSFDMVVRYSHQNGKHIDSAMDKLEKRYQIAK